MKLNRLGKGTSIAAAAGILIGLSSGVAAAAAPTASGTAASETAVGTPMSSLGIGLYNNSADNLVLQSVSGDNEGVPSAGTSLISGQGDQDFEVTFRAAKTTTVTATYSVQDDTGTALGTATIKLSVDAMAARDVSGSFKANDNTTLPLTTAYANNGNWQVEDSSPTTNNVNATDPEANTLVAQYCNDANDSATCTFTPSGHISTTQSELLVSGYTQTGGDNDPSTISLSSGYDDQTSVNTGTALTATMKLGNVLSVAISSAYNQTLAFDNTFTASESIAVNPGSTGYIWGQVPVIQYTGAMKIALGNTTWNIADMVVTSPDSTRTLTGFTTGTFKGYYPIGKPSQPPTTT
jgi:hypothetical protein